MIPDKDETESTIVEIKERGLTFSIFLISASSTIVEIKERGLTQGADTDPATVIYNSRN